MNKLNELFKRKKQKGSFSIEAAISTAVVLMVTFLGVSYFTYLMPRQVLTQEVHTLAQTAKIQGGLTTDITEPGNSDLGNFKDRLEDKGFDAKNITVEAVATLKDNAGNEHNRSVLGVEPLEQGYLDSSNYSHRNSKEVITVHVTIPAKKNFINAMTKFWTGENSHLSDYSFSETIMSERW